MGKYLTIYPSTLAAVRAPQSNQKQIQARDNRDDSGDSQGAGAGGAEDIVTIGTATRKRAGSRWNSNQQRGSGDSSDTPAAAREAVTALIVEQAWAWKRLICQKRTSVRSFARTELCRQAAPRFCLQRFQQPSSNSRVVSKTGRQAPGFLPPSLVREPKKS